MASDPSLLPLHTKLGHLRILSLRYICIISHSFRKLCTARRPAIANVARHRGIMCFVIEEVLPTTWREQRRGLATFTSDVQMIMSWQQL